MKFTLEITLGNDAMQTPEDVAYALRQVINTLEQIGFNSHGRIPDVNGNRVGEWSVSNA